MTVAERDWNRIHKGWTISKLKVSFISIISKWIWFSLYKVIVLLHALLPKSVVQTDSLLRWYTVTLVTIQTSPFSAPLTCNLVRLFCSLLIWHEIERKGKKFWEKNHWCMFSLLQSWKWHTVKLVARPRVYLKCLNVLIFMYSAGLVSHRHRGALPLRHGHPSALRIDKLREERDVN